MALILHPFKKNITDYNPFDGDTYDRDDDRNDFKYNRIERSFSLRRSSIGSSSSVPVIHLTKTTNFSPQNVIQFLQTQQFNQLIEICKIEDLDLSYISNEPTIWQLLSSFFNNFPELSDQDISILLNFTGLIFHYTDNDSKEEFTLNISRFFNDFFDHTIPPNTESENQHKLELASKSIDLIKIMTENSIFARDTLITCSEIHLVLLNLCQRSPSLTPHCLSALLSIFSHPEEIDAYIIEQTVDPIIEVLTTNCSTDNFNIQNIQLSLQIMIAMCDARSIISELFYQKNLIPLVLSLIDNSDLCSLVIHLIGHLCLTEGAIDSGFVNHEFVSSMIELLQNSIQSTEIQHDKLMEIVSSIFWLFSQLLENATPFCINCFTPEFLNASFEICEKSSFSMKKEITFFIVTFIVVSDAENLLPLINEKSFEIFDEMICCGIDYIANRMIEALQKIILKLSTSSVFPTILSLITESDIHQDLINLSNDNETDLAKRAIYLARKIESFCETPN